MNATPGPWWTGHGGFGVIKAGGMPGGIEVARLRSPTERFPYRDGEEFANAKLIASAPSLLAVCRSTLASLQQARASFPQDTAYLVRLIGPLEAVIGQADGANTKETPSRA